MKIKLTELLGASLDWAVAHCAGQAIRITVDRKIVEANKGAQFHPSTNWGQAGPLIQESSISILRCEDDLGVDSKGFCNNKRIPVWAAVADQQSTNTSYEGEHYPAQYEIPESEVIYGPTPLVAAMRAYVANQLGKKLGEEIDIPDVLK